MFVAALVVLVIAVLLLLAGLLGGQDAASMDFGWFDLDANVTVAFVLGMVCLALFGASWRLFRSATRHAVGRMRDKRRINALNSQLAKLQKDDGGDEDPGSTGSTGAGGGTPGSTGPADRSAPPDSGSDSPR